ncbi:hypothetical protein ACWEQ8_21720 [Streptomyces noursei]
MHPPRPRWAAGPVLEGDARRSNPAYEAQRLAVVRDDAAQVPFTDQFPHVTAANVFLWLPIRTVPASSGEHQ